MQHIDGAPLGTRGGISVVHTFPADGDYTFRVMLHGDADRPAVRQRREPRRADRDVDQRRARRAASTSTTAMSETDTNGLNLHDAADSRQGRAAARRRGVHPAVRRRRSTTWSRRSTTRWPTPQIGDGVGITTLPHLRDFSVTGPQRVTGVSDTPSRRKVFICRPTVAGRGDSVRARGSSRSSRRRRYRRPVDATRTSSR